MLAFALSYRQAIDDITGDRAFNLRTYELNEGEWDIVKQLCNVLKILKDATLFFSRATPNLAMVIPAMDHIDAVLATQSIDATLSASIRAAVLMGKKTLNRYYDKTDSSEVYRIAMVLHPRHKLEYFKNAGWDESWIATAKDIVVDEYKRSYADRVEPNVAVPPTPMKKTVRKLTSMSWWPIV
ncbi:hypothetical protein PLICRDRAFT_119819 [Plicaturopsis crispa FD-325 SS-3]|uniref:hAT-like transposase RNase-H fold domain-containing protein n=1 Tax=Plicaturopsis crispa FD-325 SS-3 TaxID=944288 RepID=A0A0C9SK47_PLICR|nr:hypothetical protein PLICRDRAFT_119819 [Plicaturopsis crispa FD-325 SS-3]